MHLQKSSTLQSMIHWKAYDDGFFSTLRVICIFSCRAMCILELWYSLTLWLAKLVGIAVLSENIEHAILLSVLQPCTKILHHSPSRCFEEAS